MQVDGCDHMYSTLPGITITVLRENNPFTITLLLQIYIMETQDKFIMIAIMHLKIPHDAYCYYHTSIPVGNSPIFPLKGFLSLPFVSYSNFVIQLLSRHRQLKHQNIRHA